jgi:uncharacterized protein YbjT (DUF2867 family)
VTMRATVVGGTGQFGAALCDRLADLGVDVTRAGRSTGVDAVTGAGLDDACTGADLIVDVTSTASRDGDDTAAFFGAVARNVSRAATAAGVPVVYLTIVGAGVPAVAAALGHYRGKAEQERVYAAELGDRACAVASVQWFSLAERFLAAGGDVVELPDLRCRPATVEDVVRAFADVVVDQNRPAYVSVAGPVEIDLVDIARRIAARDGSAVRVVPADSDAVLRSGALIPDSPDVVTTTTLDMWLDGR